MFWHLSFCTVLAAEDCCAWLVYRATRSTFKAATRVCLDEAAARLKSQVAVAKMRAKRGGRRVGHTSTANSATELERLSELSQFYDNVSGIIAHARNAQVELDSDGSMSNLGQEATAQLPQHNGIRHVGKYRHVGRF